MTKQLTSEEVRQKIENKENFILDLFATWCGPCKIMLDNIEKVGVTLESGNSSFKTYKFNIEDDMDLMKEWNIRGVPTIKIFKEGDEVFSKPGIMSVDQVLSLVN